MFISDQISKLISSYDRTVTNDGSNIKSSLKNLKVNDEVKVTAVKVDGDTARVRMEDGTEFTISGNVPSNTENGSVLYIRITGKQEGKPLSAEVINVEKNLELKAQELNVLLKDIGINPSKENIEVLNQMNKAGLFINKENVSKIFNSIQNENISLESAIFMLKNGIEITTKSSRAFNSMITNSDFLETNLKVLIDSLTENYEAISNAAEVIENAQDISTINIDDVIPSSEEIIPESVQLEGNANINEEQMLIKPSENSNLSTEIIANPVDKVDNTNLNSTNTAEISLVNNSKNENLLKLVPNSEESKPIIKELDFEFGQPVENEPKVQTSSTLTKENIITNEETVKTNIAPNKMEATLSKVEALNEESINISEPEVINDLSFEIEKANENDIEKNNNNQTVNRTENENDIKKTNLKNDTLNVNDLLDRKEKIKALRDEVGSLFREVKASKEFPEEITIKRIFKSFKDLLGDIENNKHILSKNMSQNIEKEVTRIKENLELISDLNKYNTVIHIPLLINENKSMAELYIFNGDKQNSRKKINEKNATMFLSLGTANIGQVETYIKVVNKTVECNFMTEKKEGTELINENKNHLAELLETYGYTLIKASSEAYNGKSLNIFEAIEKNNIKETSNAFDMKA